MIRLISTLIRCSASDDSLLEGESQLADIQSKSPKLLQQFHPLMPEHQSQNTRALSSLLGMMTTVQAATAGL